MPRPVPAIRRDGQRLYTDKQGDERTVYFTYVLAKLKNEYTVTQIASAADRK